MGSSFRMSAPFVALAALMMTVHNGFAAPNGNRPNTDLYIPTETPDKPHSFEIGTPTGISEADCIKSGGTVGVNPNGVEVCAKKIDVLPASTMTTPKPNKG
jgi:hypothetical protein